MRCILKQPNPEHYRSLWPILTTPSPVDGEEGRLVRGSYHNLRWLAMGSTFRHLI